MITQAYINLHDPNEKNLALFKLHFHCGASKTMN